MVHNTSLSFFVTQRGRFQILHYIMSPSNVLNGLYEMPYEYSLFNQLIKESTV